MKKVLHFQCSAGFWGPERQISQLIDPMRCHGFEIEVLVMYRLRPELPMTHPLVMAVRWNKGRAVQLNDRWRDLPSNVLAVARKLRSEDYALLHTHGYKSDIIGTLVSKLVGVPVVASIRGYTDRTLRLRLYKHIDLFALRWFDRVLPVSNYMRDQLLNAQLPSQRVITIYDAIAPKHFTVDMDSDPVRLRQELGLKDVSEVVSIVSRLSREKGHRYFLESVAQILESFPGAQFLVVGDGPERGSLESLTASLGIHRSVSFLGYRRDVATIMAASDVIVSASVQEGFGNVLIEAMYLAKPVVATAAGGVPEIVRHEETGLLVPPGDPDALALAMIKLLKDPQARKRMGLKGRQVVLREFSVERLADNLAKLYNEVVSTPSSRGVR
ncbi:MAG: glycosyltransferase family 4 protein [Chloroflexi bacterium]|nr:glycosyltransferase family 4 protein [Chloroflexota bacterium]